MQAVKLTACIFKHVDMKDITKPNKKKVIKKRRSSISKKTKEKPKENDYSNLPPVLQHMLKSGDDQAKLSNEKHMKTVNEFGVKLDTKIMSYNKFLTTIIR